MRGYVQANKVERPSVAYFPDDIILAFAIFVKSRWEATNCGVIW